MFYFFYNCSDKRKRIFFIPTLNYENAFFLKRRPKKEERTTMKSGRAPKWITHDEEDGHTINLAEISNITHTLFVHYFHFHFYFL